MSDTKKEMLQKRQTIKSKKPDFIMTDASYIKRLKDKWKKPKGRDNKVRRRLRGALPHPSYSSPTAVKGMHPTGYFEKLVSCIKDLEGIDAKEMIVRIRATVGNKKKREIMKKATELKLKVVNPSIALREKKDSKDTKKTKESKKETPKSSEPAAKAEKKEQPAKKEKEAPKAKKSAPAKAPKTADAKDTKKPAAKKTATKEKA